MTEMNKINFEELENVAGGKDVQVYNPSVPYANLRKAPGLDAPIKCNARSRRTAMYGTRSCSQALMTPAGSQEA